MKKQTEKSINRKIYATLMQKIFIVLASLLTFIAAQSNRNGGNANSRNDDDEETDDGNNTRENSKRSRTKKSRKNNKTGNGCLTSISAISVIAACLVTVLLK